MITAFYAGLLGLWLAYLYINVVKYRRGYQVSFGDGGKDTLNRAIRIHANFTETVPYVLILMILAEMLNYWPLLIHAAGIFLIVSRLLNFLALRRDTGSITLRVAAGVMTLGIVIVMSLLLVLSAITSGALLSF